ncbi:zinc ribbon domain-containing protein [Halorussus halobius]|uniref:zinc-ribbon domain-containing protein n=1 Tax=Halorussus halobius TaxID=1710537 RepID=UPI001092B9BB|nr:zinc-ribbon domain-containing protein [Halorussus halobius]
MSVDEPVASDRLPSALVDRLDVLDVPGLRAARTYVDERIEHCTTPIRERILAEATGEILGIEDYGPYVLVRKRPEHRDVPEDSQLVSLYHVTREKRPDSEETLNWSFIGQVMDVAVFDCEHCGRAVDERANYCPHCGHDASAHSAEGER